MQHKPDMNEENFLKRIKSADPASEVAVDESLLDGAIASGTIKARVVRQRKAFFAVAGSGVLALSLVTSMGFGQSSPTGLITLGQPGQTSGAMSSVREGSGLASDKMMMVNPYVYNYVAGEKLSDATSKGHVYKVELNGNPEALLAKLAAVFGVDGEPTTQKIDLGTDAASYEFFTVGAQDGKAKTLNLSWIGSGNWWFSDPAAYPQPVCNDHITVDLTQEVAGQAACAYEEPKPTPELVPTKAEAMSEAIRIFKSVGFNAKPEQIRVQSDQWGAWASASVQLNGEDTPIEFSVSWSSNGKISSVSGHSMKFVDKGEFKTISAKDAVSRLSDWRYNGSLASSQYDKYYYTQPLSAYGSPTTKDLTNDVVVVPGISIDQPVAEPSQTTITVVVEKAIEVHVMIWDSTGSNWLVPGYIMTSEQGALSPVYSLEDGVVALPPKN
jgi:hypothetical protein